MASRDNDQADSTPNLACSTKDAFNDNHPYAGAITLINSEIPCIVWAENALAHYGVPTMSFDVFVLVTAPKAALKTLELNGFCRVPNNIRYQFNQELINKSIRLSERPDLVTEVETEAPTTVLMPTAQWHYSEALLSNDTKELFPPLPALVASLIDAWLDAETLSLTLHLGSHLGYIEGHVPDAKTAAFVSQLEHQYHRDFWGLYLREDIFASKKPEWRAKRLACLAQLTTAQKQVKDVQQ